MIPKQKKKVVNYIRGIARNTEILCLLQENRLPANDYILIDRRWFNEIKEKYTQGSLIQELFYSEYTDLGYIDPLTVDS